MHASVSLRAWKLFFQITVHSPKCTCGVVRGEMGKYNFLLCVWVAVVTKVNGLRWKEMSILTKITLLLLIIYLRDMTQCVNNTSRLWKISPKRTRCFRFLLLLHIRPQDTIQGLHTRAMWSIFCGIFLVKSSILIRNKEGLCPIRAMDCTEFMTGGRWGPDSDTQISLQRVEWMGIN